MVLKSSMKPPKQTGKRLKKQVNKLLNRTSMQTDPVASATTIYV